jgi:hypothetical protein
VYVDDENNLSSTEVERRAKADGISSSWQPPFPKSWRTSTRQPSSLSAGDARISLRLIV